jgi:hypothetical protein
VPDSAAAADGSVDAPLDAAAEGDAPVEAAGDGVAPVPHAASAIVRLARTPSTRNFVFIVCSSPP